MCNWNNGGAYIVFIMKDRLNQNLDLIFHSLGNCRQSQTSSDSSWRSVNSSSDKLKSEPHQKLPVQTVLTTFGQPHFLVYQSLNSLVSRDFLLDVLSFLLAVVSVSLVLKNSNKPIKFNVQQYLPREFATSKIWDL